MNLTLPAKSLGATCILLILAFCPMSLFSNEKESDVINIYEDGKQAMVHGNYYQANEIFEKALIELKTNGLDQPLLEAKILVLVSECSALLKDLNSERQYIQRALKLYEKHLGVNSLEYATTIHDMALTFGEMGKYEEALDMLFTSLNVFKNDSSDLHNSAHAYNYSAIGWVYRASNDYKNAEFYLKEALRYVRMDNGNLYSRESGIRHILGYTLMYGKKPEQGLEHLQIGKELRAAEFGTDHPKYYESCIKLAECFYYLKEYQKANKQIQEVIDKLKLSDDPENLSRPRSDSLKQWSNLMYSYVVKTNIYNQQFGKIRIFTMQIPLCNLIYPPLIFFTKYY